MHLRISFRAIQPVIWAIIGALFLSSGVPCFGQDDNEEIRELDERIEEARKEQQRFKRLGDLAAERLDLLKELKKAYSTLVAADQVIEDEDSDDEQIERAERSAHESEVRIEVTNLQLEMLERRTALEELTLELHREQQELTKEAASLLKMLSAAEKLPEKLGQAFLADNEFEIEELELEFEQFERKFERRREILQLRVELQHAREEGDDEWIRELETELQERDTEKRAMDEPQKVSTRGMPTALTLSDEEVKAAAQLDFKTQILPRLEESCFACHNQDDASGDLDLSSLVAKTPFVVNRSRWLNVIQQIKVRSMPPADADQPSDADRRAMLGWLTNAIDNFDYTTVRKIGQGPARRLAHDEYNNTIRDLVGIDIRPADRFPADLSASSGFDNSANSLFIQPVTLERYVSAAESIIQASWPADASSKQSESARQRLFGDSQPLDSRESVERVIHRFASRAFRRPVGKEELTSLMNHYDQRSRTGSKTDVAVRDVLQVILISPNFLIRSEAAPAKSSRALPVSDWELASRLSYFLWASMPDDELFALAEAERLREPDVLQQQLDRMLKDDRANSLGRLFAAQWLGFAELDRVQRDQIDNPWATDSLVDAMKKESAMLFNSIVRKNASLDQFVNADYTFVNEELANHYGMKGVAGEQMRQVSLRDSPRRGILGHASILATTSLPHRTSPVVRGNWILTTLLGTPPPPPPPNVSEFSDRVAENERLSQRQKLELHRTNPNCYSCHSLIDPLGFALEEFEWFGRYRPKRRGKQVDSVGQLPNGTTFRGLQGLSATLIDERSSDLAEQLTRKMLSYALGRQLEYYDEATVRELKDQLETDDRKVGTLIRAIIHSQTFRMKQH